MKGGRRPHERPERTTVSSSYRDAARLSIPGIFSRVLHVFALSAAVNDLEVRVWVSSGTKMGVAHYEILPAAKLTPQVKSKISRTRKGRAMSVSKKIAVIAGIIYLRGYSITPS